MPNLSRRVAPASAAIVVIDSSCGTGVTRRSVCQIESTVDSSQRAIQRQNARASENGKLARPRPTRTFIGPADCVT
jgi:hypothetical protein